MGVPTVYRYDDPNAPQLAGGHTGLFDVLKACLEEGYGTGDERKEPAGWSMLFPPGGPDNRHFVIRNNGETGSGCCLHFECTDPATTANWVNYKITPCEDATAADAPLLPFTTAPSNFRTFGASSARPWMIVADDRFLFFGVTNDYASSFNPDNPNRYDATTFVFGDIIKSRAEDNYATIFSGMVTAASRYITGLANLGTTPSSINMLWARDLEGNAGGEGGGGLGLNGAVGTAGSSAVDYPSDQLLLMKPLLIDMERRVRGIVPGYVVPYANISNPLAGALQSLTLEGKNYVCYRNTNFQFLVSLDPADWNYEELL